MKRRTEDVTALQLRLKKIVGQLNGVQKMEGIESGNADETIESFAEALESFAKMA